MWCDETRFAFGERVGNLGEDRNLPKSDPKTDEHRAMSEYRFCFMNQCHSS